MRVPKIDKDSTYSILGVAFGVVAFLSLVVFSPVGCSFLPPKITRHVVGVYDDSKSLLFRKEGYYRCIISVEGPFPSWARFTRISFKDRQAFLSLSSTKYALNEAFTANSDEVVDGSISKTGPYTVRLDLQFTEKYSSNTTLNDEFDLRITKEINLEELQERIRRLEQSQGE
jgi:hypothetical protein